MKAVKAVKAVRAVITEITLVAVTNEQIKPCMKQKHLTIRTIQSNLFLYFYNEYIIELDGRIYCVL